MRSQIFILAMIALASLPGWAENNSLDVFNELNEDPSLLLDPNLAISVATVPKSNVESSTEPAVTPLIEKNPTDIPLEKVTAENTPVFLQKPKALSGAPAFLKSGSKPPALLSSDQKFPWLSVPLPPIAPAVSVAKEGEEPKGERLPASSSSIGHGPVPNTTELVALPGITDFAVILSGNQFFPAKIRLRGGAKSRLIFTTTGRRPAALVFEKLQINRWIAGENEKPAEVSLA
ncbi:MAG: hypothetical protein EB078_05810, partial [Proteobacteria bacterium]|nr:hypothetical protein [Pseudomonadota bacterium]NDG26883.1 hypothetical protein [Pseudomonadota bacterium]